MFCKKKQHLYNTPFMSLLRTVAFVCFCEILTGVCFAQEKLLFLVAGQSNAVGQGDSALSVKSGLNAAFEYRFTGNQLLRLADPVGANELSFEHAATGSAWPAFAAQLHLRSLKNIIIIPAARSGSSCNYKAELDSYGTWDTTGVLLKNAVLKTQKAVEKTGQPLSGIIWLQGERDANAINSGTITVAEYEQRLRKLIARFRQQLGVGVPFYIVETGYYKNHSKVGFDAVQAAQQRVALTVPRVFVVFKTAGFEAQNKLKDEIHYNQAALNEMGKAIADTVYQLSPHLNTAKIFGDNMVLQQGTPLKIWGYAMPGAVVSVKLNLKTVKIKTRANGQWLARLPAFNYGGPFVLEVKSHRQVIHYENVMIGEVWLASGQSNMNFEIGRPIANMEKVVAAANYPMIREFNVTRQVSKTPLNELKRGEWLVCNSGNAPQFSAVTYFFARKLHLKKKVAVGIIHASYGGTPIETWMSKEALLKHPAYNERISRQLADNTDWGAMQTIADSVNAQKDRTIKTAGNGQKLGVQKLNYNDSSWSACNYPVRATGLAAPPYSIIWFRKTIEVPAPANLNQRYMLDLGKVLESDITYVNGTEVGRSKQLDRTVYTIPPGVIRAGKNVIAMRMVSQWSDGQIGTPIDTPSLRSTDGKLTIPLSGAWQYNYALEPKLVLGNGYQNNPSAMFNGMINPLVPYGIKGILWYQGESNAANYALYKTLQPLMFNDWRRRWGNEKMPFLFVQLPNLLGATPLPWMREAQAASLIHLNTGMAVSIDAGDRYDLHPHNKQLIGERLALQAQKIAYHDNNVYEGPVYKSFLLADSTILVRFKGSLSPLVLRNTVAGTGFFIAGNDHVFYPARVKQQGNSLLISSPLVKQPAAVRYAWDADPVVSLFNRAGLPAAPFRTDAWLP
jgi:sialate O-acetylesterase